MDDTLLHVACSHCRATNRIPVARLTDDPVCGRCGKPLLDGRPITLGDADFDAFVQKTDLPVVVDFWAPWCGPCRAMAPQFEQAAAQLKGRIVFAKVNSDDSPQLSQRYAIRSIPTMIRLQKGRELDRRSGALPLGQIVSFAG